MGLLIALSLLLGAPRAGQANRWLEFGPSPIAPGNPSIWQQVPTTAGRVNAVAISPTNPDVVFIGASLGGVWRTRDGGAHWIPLLDGAPGARGIRTLTLSGSTLWIGTGGETAGDGLYRIPNAETVGEDDVVIQGPFNTRIANSQGSSPAGNGHAFAGNSINAIVVDPNAANNMWVATTDSHFHGSPFPYGDVRAEPGLYFTNEAIFPNPRFWKVPGVGPNVDDAVFVPGGPSGPSLIVGTINPAGGPYGSGSVHQLGALPLMTIGYAPTIATRFTFVAGISQAQIDLAASGSTVYASTSQDVGTLYKSTDGGVTFLRGVTTTPAAGQFRTNAKGWGVGGHTGGVAVDPTNPNNVLIGGAASEYGRTSGPWRVLMASHDGGQTFRTADGPYSTPGGSWLSYLHPDTVDIAFAPSNPDIAYTVNDGGVYRTNNARDASGSSPDLSPIAWTSLNTPGLGITQFYDMAVHPTDLDYTLAGSQDNGAVLFDPSGGHHWKSVLGGDVFSVAIDQNAPNTTAVTLYGDCSRADSTFNALNGGPYVSITGPCGSTQFLRTGSGFPRPLYGGFNTREIARSLDQGSTWDRVSPPQPDPSDPDYLARLNGWTAYAIHPSLDDRRLFVSHDGEVYSTFDASINFSAASIGNWPTNHPGFQIRAAAFMPNNPNAAVLGFAGYSDSYVGPASKSHVWLTNNLSAPSPTWTAIGDGLPDVPVNALV
ncbi:hypothetical protein K2X89_10735, partial [Myxococcota bacterium]|nr:hypothetical protein [Myxococcota bacterium]